MDYHTAIRTMSSYLLKIALPINGIRPHKKKQPITIKTGLATKKIWIGISQTFGKKI